MPSFIRKDKADILRQALSKVEKTTPITALGAGSVARAIIESVTSEIGDMYDILDFNMNQTVVSTASGRALDLFGVLYNIQRKTLSDLNAVDKKVGAFYFEIKTPYVSDITIPDGTTVYTDITSYVGTQFAFKTVGPTIIVAGRVRAYATLKPANQDSVFTAGKNTLVIHDFTPPVGVILTCTNPKPIAPQNSYEDDDSYRLRLIKGIRVASSGTRDALRFAGLGITGVRDVKIREAPYGLGSFEVLVVPEANINADMVTAQLATAMDSVRPIGVTMYIRNPINVPFDVEVDLLVPFTDTSTTLATMTSRAEIAIFRYLNTLLPGDTLVYNGLIQNIMDSSNLIKDVVVRNFAANGVQALRRNYTPDADEQIIPGRIVANIAKS